MNNRSWSKSPEDWDFIAFTYGGVHSLRDLKLYRVSNGNRYEFNIKNPTQDKTQNNSSADGAFYFSSQQNPLTIVVNFAYDKLFQEDIRRLKQVFNGKEIKELIFEEYPYKVYDAKVTGQPILNYNVFDDNDGRTVYKGTGSVTFTCYFPYAHTPTDLKDGLDGKYINYYIDPNTTQPIYPTFYEWNPENRLLSELEIQSAKITVTKEVSMDGTTIPTEYTETITIPNKGEAQGPFILTCKGYTPRGTIIKTFNGKIKILEPCYNLTINTKTGCITGQKTIAFYNKTWLKDPKNTETATDENFDAKVIAYEDLNRNIIHGGWSLSAPQVIKYNGSPFLMIQPTPDGTSMVEIIYNTTDDSSVSILNISLADSAEGQYTAYRNFMLNVWDKHSNSTNHLYNDEIANALNLQLGQRTIDYQFWYY